MSSTRGRGGGRIRRGRGGRAAASRGRGRAGWGGGAQAKIADVATGASAAARPAPAPEPAVGAAMHNGHTAGEDARVPALAPSGATGGYNSRIGSQAPAARPSQQTQQFKAQRRRNPPQQRRRPQHGTTGTKEKEQRQQRQQQLLPPQCTRSSPSPSTTHLSQQKRGGGPKHPKQPPHHQRRLLRILCLHGNEQTAEIFSTRLAKLQQRSADLVAHFEFLNGVEELPLRPGQQAATRCWWTRRVVAPRKATAAATAADSNGSGDNSGDPDVNAPRVAAAVAAAWRERGPFDGILGFSQGAACALLLLLLRERGEVTLPGLRFVVLAGGYLPGHRDVALSCAASLRRCELPSLHLGGRRDRAVPLQDSQAAAARFQVPRTHWHDGGHEFPLRAGDLSIVREFLQQFVGEGPPPRPQPEETHAAIAAPAQAVAGAAAAVAASTPARPPKHKFARIPGAQVAAAEVLADPGNWAVPENEDVRDELESLDACFPDEFQRLVLVAAPKAGGAGAGAGSAAAVVDFRVQLTLTEGLVAADADALALRVRLPAGYPNAAPLLFQFETRPAGTGAGQARRQEWAFAAHPDRYCDYPTAALAAAERAIQAVVEENPGECVALQVLAAAQEALEEFLAGDRSTSSTNTNVGVGDTGGDPGAAPSDTESRSGNGADGAGACNGGGSVGAAAAASTAWWDEEFEFVPDDEAGPEAEGGDANDVGGAGATVADGGGGGGTGRPARAPDPRLLMVQEAVDKAAARAYAEEQEAAASKAATFARYASSQHGVWDFVVGLVGKPSAGKSTFFNAASRPRSERLEAKVGAFPFTTIDSNVAHATFSALDPAEFPVASGNGSGSGAGTGAGTGARVGCSSTTATTHSGSDGGGTARVGATKEEEEVVEKEEEEEEAEEELGLGRRPCHRYHRITLKDVAGLVPGAYCGRGRGNAFLGDLCDADVLVHIVDAAGLCDENGNGLLEAAANAAAAAAVPGKGNGAKGKGNAAAPAATATVGDPLKDISWVSREIHLWIFENARRKWHGVRKRPQRLLELFTGYRATQAMVLDALRRMGFRTDQVASGGGSAAAVAAARGKERSKVHWENTLQGWGARDLHELVAHFVRIRFPIVVALNKIDLARTNPPGTAAGVAAAPAAAARTATTLSATVPAAAAAATITTINDDGLATASVVDACAVTRNVQRIRAALPHEAVECVSASLEWTLVKLRRAAAEAAATSGGDTGAGDDVFADEHRLPAGLQAAASRRLRRDLAVVRPFCRGTGVLDCVNRAVAAKQPVLVYPVASIETCEALGGGGRLALCVPMKWGSTVEDLWKHLARQPAFPHMRGDFVRAEARGFDPTAAGPGASGAARCVVSRKANAKKVDVLSARNCIIQIMVNKKISWQ